MTRMMLHSVMHAANVQDRDSGMMVMATLFGLWLDGCARLKIIPDRL